MRSDSESIVLVVWVVLALVVPVAVIYDGWANGFGWGHLAVLAGGEALLALVARVLIRVLRR
jgi:hypothetical protein